MMSRHTLIFAAFDGEERGYLGAKEFVLRPPLDFFPTSADDDDDEKSGKSAGDSGNTSSASVKASDSNADSSAKADAKRADKPAGDDWMKRARIAANINMDMLAHSDDALSECTGLGDNCYPFLREPVLAACRRSAVRVRENNSTVCMMSDHRIFHEMRRIPFLYFG